MKARILIILSIIVFVSCNNVKVININKPLLRTEYIFEAEDMAYLKVNETGIEILRGENLIKRYTEYSVYADQYGYKSIQIGNDIFTLIDGENKYFVITHNDNWNKKTSFIDLPSSIRAHNIYAQYYNDARLNGYAINEIVASSELEDATTRYYATNVLKAYGEGDVFWYWVKNNSVWAEGVDGDGIGEYLEFSIKRPERDETKGDIFLYIINGYVDPGKPNLFYENNRIKRAKLIIDNKEEKEIDINDYVEIKEVALKRSSSKVRLVIESVYPGKKYKDTCLTSLDIKFYVNRK